MSSFVVGNLSYIDHHCRHLEIEPSQVYVVNSNEAMRTITENGFVTRNPANILRKAFPSAIIDYCISVVIKRQRTRRNWVGSHQRTRNVDQTLVLR